MAHLFSAENRFYTWRKLWLTLAIAEKQLGLHISDAAIEEMKQNLVHISHFSTWMRSSSRSLRSRKRRDVMM